MKQIIDRLRRQKLSLLERLWLGLPLSIWFAYRPLIHFGQDGTMNYELSITVIYLLVLSLVSLETIWRHRRQIWHQRTTWLVSGFVWFSCLTVLWTMNLTRGVLVAGITGMLWLVFLGALAERHKLVALRSSIIKVYVWSSVVVSLLAIGQFVAGIWFDPSITLLCAGCVAEQFGFVRPNAFLIEPQFLGNALIPAVMILVWRIVGQRRSQDWRGQLALGLVFMIMVLTLSRGALLATAVGLVVLFVVTRRYFRQWLMIGGVLVAGLALALGAQGLAASINPKINETFFGAVGKSINQLSLGTIEIRENNKVELEEKMPVQPVTQPSVPNFDGYVEESTLERTRRSELAFNSWKSDWWTIWFGAGLGSAGLAMHRLAPEEIGAREIVQNEYIEILLERGIIGLVGFLAILGGLLWLTRRHKWLWAIILAFMVQWNFFSGYPNALHIYLTLIFIGSVGVLNVKAKLASKVASDVV